MTHLRSWIARFGGLFAKQRCDREFSEELESHLQMHIEDNLRAGMAPEEARRQAFLKLGGMQQTKESYRERRGLLWLESLLQDIHFGVRVLHKNPGFTAVAVLTLALGIGATTSMFTVVDGVILKSLGYPNAERIVTINTHWTDSRGTTRAVTGGDLEDLRDANDCFEAFSFFDGGESGVQLSHSAEFVGVYEVDPDFFRVFEIPPLIGRTLASEDAGRAAVVSLGFALRNFGSASAALGQTARIDNTAYLIVGVMPPNFQFPRQAQMWAAVSLIPSNRNRTSFNFRVAAKVRPGVALAVVNERLLSIANRLAATFPDSNRNKTFAADPLQQELAAPVRRTLFVLLGSCGLVLLIACANVANLILARSAGRSRELAVRAVLGAGEARLILQLLCESMILSAAAGLFGIALAVEGTKALLVLGARFLPAPLLVDIRFDWRVFAFAAMVTFLTSILFGIAPAWRATRVNLQGAMKQGRAHGSLGGIRSQLRDSLVISQIALALPLTISASLLFRTTLALHSTPLGYHVQGILVTYAHAPAHTLAENLQAGRFFEALFARLRTLPRVISVAGAMGMPAGQYGSNGAFAVEGKQKWCGDAPGCDYREYPYAVFALASPGYFATMGIPLTQGREFTDADLYDRPFAAIISESLADKYFPHEDPIGHRVICGFDSTEKWMTIVGVVGDVRQDSPAAQPRPELYMPLLQHPFMANELQVVVRTSGRPQALFPFVQRIIRDTNPEVAMKFTTMEEMVTNSISAQRFRAALAITFAALALLLALSGMYAVVSYVTAQRTGEFGLRSALGAQPANIVVLVLRGAIRIALIGVIAGVLLSMIAARLLASMLFGVSVTDTSTYTLVIAIVLPVVILAAAVPAWRASRVDPMVALRYE
jgi:putative ABC transport system permease protein